MISLIPSKSTLGPSKLLSYSHNRKQFVHNVTDSSKLVLLEAIAYRTPVVDIDVGGIPTIIGDGEMGFAVPRSHTIVAEKLSSLDDGTLREEMGKDGP